MPEGQVLVTFPSPERAARHHASTIGAISRGGWIFAADGARLARGWTAYAVALLQDGVILPDGDGYRLASADTTIPDTNASDATTTPGAVELDPPAAPSARATPDASASARPAPELNEAGHATARALLADPEMLRALDARDDRAVEAATLRVTGMALEAPVVGVLLRLHLDAELSSSRSDLASLQRRMASTEVPANASPSASSTPPIATVPADASTSVASGHGAEVPADATPDPQRPRQGRRRTLTPDSVAPTDADLVAVVQRHGSASLRQIGASVWPDLPWGGGTGSDSATGRLRKWSGPTLATGPHEATAASWLSDRLDCLVERGTLYRGLPRQDEVDRFAGQVYLPGCPAVAPALPGQAAPLPPVPAQRTGLPAQGARHAA